MAYNENSSVKGRIKPSPSMLYNNLCTLGADVAYASMRQVMAVKLSTAQGKNTEQRKLETQDFGRVQTVRTCHHKQSAYVVVATELGVQVWDQNGTHLLMTWKLPAAAAASSGGSSGRVPAADTLPFARGAAIALSADGGAQICVGSSNGSLFVFAVSEEGRVRHASTWLHTSQPILALSSAYQCRGGTQSDDCDNTLVSSSEDGTIVVWEAATSTSYSCAATISAAGDHGRVAATSLAVRKDLIVCARLSGVVQIFGRRDLALKAEIEAHSRWITAMDIHPTRDVIVTAAEDCTLNVWQLPLGGRRVAALLSICWITCPITGVAFCGPRRDDIAAVAYDTDEIQVWRASGTIS